MSVVSFPVIDPVATGKNIRRLRQARGLSVRDLQRFFGFEEPQAIYKWQWGKTLPSIDNLYALSALLNVHMDEILVPMAPDCKALTTQPQASACGCVHIRGNTLRISGMQRLPEAA